MESLRFKMAWLCGCVPVKVVGDVETLPDDLPFSAWIVREHQVIEYLRALRFTEARRRFREEYLHLPRLDEGLASMFRDYGYCREQKVDHNDRTRSQASLLGRAG
jgi:hypothetical protein